MKSAPVGELVAERERDREVGVEVQVVPRLVAQPLARRACRHDTDAEEQGVRDGRHQYVGVADQQGAGLADDGGVRGDGVAPDDEESVRAGQRDRVAPAHRVPARQPVGADAALDRRNPRHEQQQYDDGVAGEQPGDAAGVGQPVTEALHHGGVVPPEREHEDSAGADAGEHGRRAQPCPGCPADPDDVRAGH